MDLFSRADDTTVQNAASKLSNGIALTVTDLGREPAKGLLRVVDHVQGSVPVLLSTHTEMRTTHAVLKGCLEEAKDARDGVASVAGSVSEHARRRMRDSLVRLAGAPAGRVSTTGQAG